MRTTLLILAIFAAPLCAKEELVTLPERDSVQLTIYNSEDLTLVRERRSLSFKQGNNRLQFSWANTLIDPTSVEFTPVGAESRAVLEVADTSYPAQSHEMLIWTVACKAAGSHVVEISYFTSGISWSAEYTGMVNADETAMDLTAFVTVTNRSGEDYENASVRLVVGTINLVERIIDLAQPPMADPSNEPRPPSMAPDELRRLDDDDRNADKGGLGLGGGRGGMQKPKAIEKAGLSEYYIYTVEGRETIPNNWGKRLRSFVVADIPLKTVYTLKPRDFGPQIVKVLQFKNDEEHKLGREPLPDGMIRLYRRHGAGLGFMGALASKYIPKNEDVKVNVGPDAECTLKETRRSLRRTDLTFRNNVLLGHTTVEEFELELSNFRGRAVHVEIHRQCAGQFDFASADPFTLEDAATRKIELELPPGKRILKFTLTTRHGANVR